jgi:hypothetical protein
MRKPVNAQHGVSGPGDSCGMGREVSRFAKDHTAVSHVYDHKGDYKELSAAEDLIKGELQGANRTVALESLLAFGKSFASTALGAGKLQL